MTSEHIITVREAFPCNISSSVTKGYHEPIKGAHALSCASISNITAFRLPSAEQSWCILVLHYRHFIFRDDIVCFLGVCVQRSS